MMLMINKQLNDYLEQFNDVLMINKQLNDYLEQFNDVLMIHQLHDFNFAVNLLQVRFVKLSLVDDFYCNLRKRNILKCHSNLYHNLELPLAFKFHISE